MITPSVTAAKPTAERLQQYVMCAGQNTGQRLGSNQLT